MFSNNPLYKKGASLHRAIATQNFGDNRHVRNLSSNQNNRSQIIRKAKDVITNPDYINNWFGESANNWFVTEYVTGILKGCYFITLDHFMNSKIYALRKITSDGIETILDGEEKALKSLEQAKQLLKKVTI